jgi:hypothetical protein
MEKLAASRLSSSAASRLCNENFFPSRSNDTQNKIAHFFLCMPFHFLLPEKKTAHTPFSLSRFLPLRSPFVRFVFNFSDVAECTNQLAIFFSICKQKNIGGKTYTFAHRKREQWWEEVEKFILWICAVQIDIARIFFF